MQKMRNWNLDSPLSIHKCVATLLRSIHSDDASRHEMGIVDQVGTQFFEDAVAIATNVSSK